MFNENFINKKQYIDRNNELNKGFEKKTYQQGANKKVELDQKLEALSINNGIMVSGQLARKNVLNNAVKSSASVSYVTDVVLEESSEENSLKKTHSNFGFNRGKEIINQIKIQEDNKDKKQF